MGAGGSMNFANGEILTQVPAHSFFQATVRLTKHSGINVSAVLIAGPSPYNSVEHIILSLWIEYIDI